MPGSAGLSGSVAESFLNVQVTTGVPYFDAVNTTVPAGCSALPSSFQSSGMSTIFTWVPAGMVHVPVFVGSKPLDRFAVGRGGHVLQLGRVRAGVRQAGSVVVRERPFE